jgi:hypothetical protein
MQQFRHEISTQAFSKNHMVYTLKNLNTSDEDFIYECLDWASHDAWDYIQKNRKQFPQSVINIVNRYDETYLSSTPYNLKIKVDELTDKDRIMFEKQDRSDREKEFEKLWLAHKATIPERPLSGIDSEADDAWEKLVQAKDSLTKYLATRKSAYIPPSQRGKQTIDPKQEEIEKHIQKMQKEFDKIEKNIELEDNDYYAKKKSQFRKDSLYLF